MGINWQAGDDLIRAELIRRSDILKRIVFNFLNGARIVIWNMDVDLLLIPVLELMLVMPLILSRVLGLR